MSTETIPGFIGGVVAKNDDPEGTGRIKVNIPGMYKETPFWVMPAGWPGAGGLNKGSQYPPPDIGAPVFVMFAMGKAVGTNVQAVYLTGYYGLDSDMQSAGPPVVHAAATAELANKRVCLWEDDTFIAYMVNDPGDGTRTADKRFVVQTKETGSKIEINAADGDGAKSETIAIEARTAVSIYSDGIVDISGLRVQIQGRVVSELTRAAI